MKITATVSQDAMQFNLTPETDAEREMTCVMAKHTGQIRINQGAHIGMCMGGYLRTLGQSENCLAITIERSKEPT